MVTQKERVSASIVILQQMVSPCGFIAVLPPIFRMVTLFRMVAFIPAHRSEAYALTKKDARRETALFQTLVVHHITSTFAMEQLHGRARLAHKYIYLTISRFQTHFPDLSIHTIHSIAHISRMLRHNYTVVLIQIEHNFFLRTKVNSLDEMEKAACFGWLRYDGYSAFLHLIIYVPTKRASVTVVTKTLREKGRLPTLPHCIAVPSAQMGLTSLFGMGRGGTPPQ